MILQPLTVRGSADLWSAILDPASERKPDIGVDAEVSHIASQQGGARAERGVRSCSRPKATV